MKQKIAAIILCAVLSGSSLLGQMHPDRKWLTQTYLSSLEGRILFVGVGVYTVKYYTFVKTPETFETIDLVSERAKYGSPYGHHIGDFLTFDPGYKYDHICLFGVMGHFQRPKGEALYNITNRDAITMALEHATDLLEIGGTLQLGPSRTAIAQFNTAYWKARFKKYPLDKYKVISNGVGTNNMLWWGEKIKD